MKIKYKIFNSFEDLEKDFKEEQFNQTAEQRIADVEFCRRQYCLMKGIKYPTPINKKVYEIVDKK